MCRATEGSDREQWRPCRRAQWPASLNLQRVYVVFAPPGVDLRLEEGGLGVTCAEPENRRHLALACTLDRRQADDPVLELLAEAKFSGGQTACLLGNLQAEHNISGKVELHSGITEQGTSPNLEIKSCPLQFGV